MFFKFLIIQVRVLQFFLRKHEFASFLIKALDTTANKFRDDTLMVELKDLCYTK